MEKKLCICISGGLDSYTAVRYAQHIYCPEVGLDFQKDVVLLSIRDMDSPYSLKEMNTMDLLYSQPGLPPRKTVVVWGYGRIAQTDDHVILGRNIMVASMGIALAPEVWISGTLFENNDEMYDKNYMFFQKMSDVAQYVCRYKREWSPDKPPTLVLSPFQGGAWGSEFPFPEWDKHHMIKWLETTGYREWRQTVTCFHPELTRCGSCIVCGKRYIYEKFCEITYGIQFSDNRRLEDTYANDPRGNAYLLGTLGKMKEAETTGDFRRYWKERIAIYKTVLGESG
jgi:7-cyano-7-deazaguanine synthase in queuosine biosynthesis